MADDDAPLISETVTERRAVPQMISDANLTLPKNARSAPSVEEEPLVDHALERRDVTKNCSTNLKVDAGQRTGEGGSAPRSGFQVDVTNALNIVCRHDACHHTALLQTGEQYSAVVALIVHVTETLGRKTKWIAYDCACRLVKYIERTRPDLQFRFLIPHMHVMAHGYACQSKFDPFSEATLGYCEFECTERFQSALRPWYTILASMTEIHFQETLTLVIEGFNSMKSVNMAHQIQR